MVVGTAEQFFTPSALPFLGLACAAITSAALHHPDRPATRGLAAFHRLVLGPGWRLLPPAWDRPCRLAPSGQSGHPAEQKFSFPPPFISPSAPRHQTPQPSFCRSPWS